MILLIGALRQEVGFLRRRLGLRADGRGTGLRLWRGEFRGKTVLLVRSGIGRRNAEAAARYAFESYPVEVLVSYGFAGALSEDLRAGDIILCSDVRSAEQTEEGAQSYPVDPDLLARSDRALCGMGIGFRQGSLVTATDAVHQPEEKLALRRASGADIVDMESFWLARAATDRNVPFLTARAISDSSQERMPPFGQMLAADGKWKRKAVVCYFLRRPRHLAAILRLYRNIRRARRSLATAVEGLLIGLASEEDS